MFGVYVYVRVRARRPTGVTHTTTNPTPTYPPTPKPPKFKTTQAPDTPEAQTRYRIVAKDWHQPEQAQQGGDASLFFLYYRSLDQHHIGAFIRGLLDG